MIQTAGCQYLLWSDYDIFHPYVHAAGVAARKVSRAVEATKTNVMVTVPKHRYLAGTKSSAPALQEVPSSVREVAVDAIKFSAKNTGRAVRPS